MAIYFKKYLSTGFYLASLLNPHIGTFKSSGVLLTEIIGPTGRIGMIDQVLSWGDRRKDIFLNEAGIMAGGKL
jgi:hypothetical protein